MSRVHEARVRRARTRTAAPTSAAWLPVVVPLLVVAAVGGCDRSADIRDEPDGSSLDPDPILDAGEIPDLDSGLGTDAYPACGERPLGDCQGVNDFPCEFQSWMNRTAARCQQETGCRTNGFLEVTMGADGCVAAIGMDQPNDAIVACLLAEMGTVRCPCGLERASYFFGTGHDGDCAGQR